MKYKDFQALKCLNTNDGFILNLQRIFNTYFPPKFIL